MKPLHAYKQQSLVNWTRIDMLLALYDKAIEHCQLATSDGATVNEFHRLRATRLVMHLRLGLNLDMGELPQRIGQLLEFVHHTLLAGDQRKITEGLSILRTLREAFASIRAEALILESCGEIPPVDADTAVERLA